MVDIYEADQLSRNLNLNLEWSATDDVFSLVLKAFPFRPTIDLFALPTYLSWKPDPFARYVYAFTVNWALHPFYAFPPLILKGLCLQKKKKPWWWGYRVFIVPTWPTQRYFGSLFSMLVDQPLYFKATRTTLTNPSVGELTYPLRVTLSVCRVSGNALSSAGFWQKLPTSFCQRGERIQLSNTMCTSRNGPFMRAPVLRNFGLSSLVIYQSLPLFVPEHC